MNRFRLATVRERRGFTLLGWGVLSGTLVALIILFILTIYPFLALTRPVQGEVLVVEGWLPDYALGKARNRFQDGNYQLLVTSGGELWVGSHLSRYKTWARLAAATLTAQGVSAGKIIAASAPRTKKDRTYVSAREVKKQLTEKGLLPASIDVVSLGPHSRRTWIIYQMIFSPDTQVGIYSIQSRRYNPEQWWSSSEGVRAIINETIAYLYVRFIFNPPTSREN